MGLATALPRWATLALLALGPTASAFYIPGWSIKSYREADPIPLLVNKVSSDSTQLQYAYYDLPFVCPPTGRRRRGSLLSGQSIPLNLGEVLRGDRIAVSDLELAMQRDRPCAFLCDREVSGRDLRRARDMVRDGYVVEWIVDNLPGAASFVRADRSAKYYAPGFKLGSTEYAGGRPRYYLHNHHTIIIRYRDAPGKAGEKGAKVVVGFEVYPKSIGPSNERGEDRCPVDLSKVEEKFELGGKMMMMGNGTRKAGAGSSAGEVEDWIDDDARITIPYTYSVYFREDSSIEWNRRWDLYFVNQEDGSRVHWMAIINSLIICGLLTAIVLVILARTVRSDIKAYRDGLAEGGKLGRKSKPAGSGPSEKAPGLLEQVGGAEDVDSDDEGMEDVTGWKLLHADVFRPPAYGYLLAPLVGSGTQLLFMATGLILLGALGILNPSFRGGFISFGIGLFVFAGLFSGYFSSRVYKTFGGANWRSNAAVTALLFPGLMFGIVFVLNLFVWAQASSTAMPFGTLVAIVALWLCVQVPLVYAGARYGFRRGGWEHPTKTAGVARAVPRQPWYTKGARAVLLAGLIPFAVIFIELLFVFQSVWEDKGYYYVFGFLAVVFAILVVTVAEVTVVSVYVQLCSEDPRWWWRSFLVGGASAAWLWLYCVWYYAAKLRIEGFVSSMLFFSYSFMACCVYALLTGTVGFLTSVAFVRRIYRAIKVD